MFSYLSDSTVLFVNLVFTLSIFIIHVLQLTYRCIFYRSGSLFVYQFLLIYTYHLLFLGDFLSNMYSHFTVITDQLRFLTTMSKKLYKNFR